VRAAGEGIAAAAQLAAALRAALDEA